MVLCLFLHWSFLGSWFNLLGLRFFSFCLFLGLVGRAVVLWWSLPLGPFFCLRFTGRGLLVLPPVHLASWPAVFAAACPSFGSLFLGHECSSLGHVVLSFSYASLSLFFPLFATPIILVFLPSLLRCVSPSSDFCSC